MKLGLSMFIFLSFLLSCKSQTEKRPDSNSKIIGGPCEGCEAVYEYGNKTLSSIDTLPLFEPNEPKLRLSGTVYQSDGKTPVEGVIIYIYHTDRKGVYPKNGDQASWANRHGFVRGWVKTDKSGFYTFYSFRPASYPDRSTPEHIHMFIKEPDKNEYYIDEIFFEDDSLLSKEYRSGLQNRGGLGIVKPTISKGLIFIKRDIVLGLNIPNY